MAKTSAPKKTPSPKKETRSYTTTSGEKVIKYSDGSEKRTPGKNKSQADMLLERGNAMIEQTKAEGAKPFKDSTYEADFKKKNPKFVEPTVISDVTIRDKVIPDIKKRTDALAETGQFYDNMGNLHNSDGSIADDNETEDPRQKQVDDLQESADDDSQMIMGTLDKLMKQTDTNTASQVRSIKNQYDVRRQQIEEINKREQAATDTSLLLGGSSRYTSSGVGISAAFERAGIMELATIDAQEQAAISEVKAAQADQNYKLASEKLSYAEELRKEKIAKATEIANTIAEENKAMTQTIAQQAKEYAIADLYTQGVTDPMEIFGLLSEAGQQASLKEISDLMKIINPSANLSGLSSDYRTYKAMQDAGEIPDGWDYFDYKTAVGNASRAPKASPYESDGSFDFFDAKVADVKSMVKQTFPGEFGSQLILELTDEELREFMTYYQNETETGQMNIDPELAFEEWAQTFGVNQEEEKGSLASKIEELFK